MPKCSYIKHLVNIVHIFVVLTVMPIQTLCSLYYEALSCILGLFLDYFSALSYVFCCESPILSSDCPINHKKQCD
jgi:hypothetical protein